MFVTVWVFGASYAQHYTDLNDQWMTIVSTELNTDLKVYALVGSSVEYTYYNFNQVRSEIKEGDVIILPITTNAKRWFFKDYPSHTGYPTDETTFENLKLKYDDTGYPEVNEAISLHEDYLKNMETFDTYLLNFLYNVNYFSKQKKLHTILLISYFDTDYFFSNKKNDFPYINFANDKLLSISLDEYSKKFLLDHNFSTADIKINHLLKSNHKILANKILDNIRYKTPIDLTKGFIKHLITDESLNNPKFIEEELFNYRAKNV